MYLLYRTYVIHFIYAPIPAQSRKGTGSVGLKVIDGFQYFNDVDALTDYVDDHRGHCRAGGSFQTSVGYQRGIPQRDHWYMGRHRFQDTGMLIFLMRDGKADTVVEQLDWLTAALGIETFRKLFPVILTDNGSEFKHTREMETTEEGEQRTKVFYCDPQASWQKAHIEKNHEYPRF